MRRHFTRKCLVALGIVFVAGAGEFLNTPPAFAFLGQGMFGSLAWIVPIGVQYDLSLAALTSKGWTVCVQQTYATHTTLSAITSACNGQWLILACRLTGSSTLQIAAAAQASYLFGRSDPQSTFSPPTHNGAAFYYSPGNSIGFAAAGSSVTLNSADAGTTAPHRLSWHIDQSFGGYRCGGGDLNSSTSYEKIVLKSPY